MADATDAGSVICDVSMSSPQSTVWKDAPELAIPDVPALFCDSGDLWLAYRSHRGYAIVQFVDVIDHRLSPINDEGLGEHPYAKAGLRFYAFNEITGSAETIEWAALRARHWAVTFKDNTLDVIAGDAKIVARDLPASSPTEALCWTVGNNRPRQMNSTVNLSFRYLESDYVRAVRAHCGSRARLGLSIVWAVVLAACGLYLWRSPGLQRLGLGFLIGSIICALILFAALTIIPSFSFRREPKFRDDYSLTFSPDGIRFCTAHVDSQLQWSMYSRALVDSHSYVLYYGSRQFTVIPKRVFQSAEQQQSFEQLLTQHISKIIRRV